MAMGGDTTENPFGSVTSEVRSLPSHTRHLALSLGSPVPSVAREEREVVCVAAAAAAAAER